MTLTADNAPRRDYGWVVEELDPADPPGTPDEEREIIDTSEFPTFAEAAGFAWGREATRGDVRIALVYHDWTKAGGEEARSYAYLVEGSREVPALFEDGREVPLRLIRERQRYCEGEGHDWMMDHPVALVDTCRECGEQRA